MTPTEIEMERCIDVRSNGCMTHTQPPKPLGKCAVC